MALRLGDTAPDFTQESSEGTNQFFYEYLGRLLGGPLFTSRRLYARLHD